LVCLLGVFSFLGGIRVIEFAKWMEAFSIMGTGSVLGGMPTWVDSAKLALIGLIFLGIGIGGLASLVFRPRTEGEIVFPGASGPVSVTIGGIEDFLKRAVTGIKGVDDAYVRVGQGPDGIEPTVTVSSLSIEGSFAILTRRVQDIVKDELRETLGLTKVGEVKVRVQKFRRRAPSRDIPPASMGDTES
jgi:hypothetical protein